MYFDSLLNLFPLQWYHFKIEATKNNYLLVCIQNKPKKKIPEQEDLIN